jgi:predicted transcriptional regulator
VFESVAPACASFSRAADELHLTQPAVSDADQAARGAIAGNRCSSSSARRST